MIQKQITPDGKPSATIPQTCAETLRLVDYMRGAAMGKLFTYAELSGIVGADVRVAKRHWLESAKRILVARHGIVFESVRGQGLRRLSDGELPALADHDRKGIHRRAGRSARKLACANVEALSTDQKTKLYVGLATLAVVRHVTGAQQQKRLTGIVITTQQRLPVASAIEALK